MEDHTHPKRLQIGTLVVYPDLTAKRTKTDLYQEHIPRSARQEPRDQIQQPAEFIPTEEDRQVTDHQQRTLQECVSWEKCREELLKAHFESEFVSAEEICAKCKAQIRHEEHIRCTDCSRHAYFCTMDCLKVNHNGNQQAFHKPQIWNSAEKKYCFISMDVHLRRTDHSCTGQYLRSGIQAFDQQGRIHTINIVVCPCEKNATTLLRHQLWASSVENPSVCFHIEFLKWIEYLVLEARCSVLSVCQSVRWKNNLTAHQFNTLYRGVIGECFEQFRHFNFRVRNIHLIDSDKCPACPKQSGSVFISLDANFGLVRKKNSGTSLMEPKHSGKIFVERSVEDLLKSNKDNSVNKDTLCSHFQAGDHLRSKNKAAKLDITGVFGSCCRHGVPLMFINLDRGERLCYSLHVINKLLDELRGTNVKLHILYDIACLLYRHIQVKHDPGNYEGVAFAVPIFHAYAHRASCQVRYSTRWLPGFGLTDGEEMERIWAYLRRFSVITKEMTPSHRIDLLTDALLHYKQKKVTDLDLSLAKAMEKAQCVIKGTEVELQAACRDLPGISISKVDEWIQQDKDNLNKAPISEEPMSDEEKYVHTLLLRDNIIDTYIQCKDIGTQQKLQKQHTKLVEEIENMERKQHIRRSWQPSDSKFIKYKKSLEEKKKMCHLRKLYGQAQEYKFTFTLRQKYCTGSAIAERLSRNIKKVSKRMRKAITEYNNVNWSYHDELPSNIKWEDASDPSAEIYTKLDSPDMMRDDEVSYSERQRLVDLRNRSIRAQEEINLTKEDMISSLAYLHEKFEALLRAIRNNVDRSTGVIIALRENVAEVRKAYFRANSIFSRYITTPEIPDNITYPTELDEISNSVLADEMHITEIEEIEDDDYEEDDEEE